MAQNFLSKSSIHSLPEEKILFKSNPHWLFLFMPILECCVFLFIYLFFVCPFLGTMNLDNAGEICPLISLFLFFFLILIIYLDWKFNRLYLTNLRLIKERGIIGKRFMAIGLDKIQDIACSYGIIGRIFGFGDLIIESAGTEGKLVFEGMPSPKKIKWMIERETSRFSPKSAL